ncbi:unnamed protein product [Arctia plantaginis]|uniref:Uncharacterized protein n=1 Tax=Arctia plantaginis TaxID=874455 RepID=A0A8S0ZI57_ARCPL|nr:unnamed protein product [Arctia plantaginis]
MESHMNDTVEVVVEERAPDKDIEKNTSVEEESSMSIEDNERSDREDPTYIASDSSSDQDDEYSECLITDDSLVATQNDAVIQEKKRVRRVPESSQCTGLVSKPHWQENTNGRLPAGIIENVLQPARCSSGKT